MFIINVLTGVGGTTAIAIILAMILAILLALSFHEYAHALVAYKCGDLTPKVLGRLTLNPFKHLDPIGTIMLLLFGFGYAKPVPINTNNFKHYKRDMAFVSIAGIVFNIILAFLGSIGVVLISYYFPMLNFASVFLNFFFEMFVVYNISLAIFNLLPIYPLDGFNFMMTFIKDKGKFLQFSVRYGSIILIGVIIAFSWLLSDLNNLIYGGFTSLWKIIFGF